MENNIDNTNSSKNDSYRINKLFETIRKTIKSTIGDKNRNKAYSLTGDTLNSFIENIIEIYGTDAENLGITDFKDKVENIFGEIVQKKVNEIIDSTIEFYKNNKKKFTLDDVVKSCIYNASSYGLESFITEDKVRDRYDLILNKDSNEGVQNENTDVIYKVYIESIVDLEIYILEKYRESIYAVRFINNPNDFLKELIQKIENEIIVPNSIKGNVESIIENIIYDIFYGRIYIDDDLTRPKTPGEIFRDKVKLGNTMEIPEENENTIFLLGSKIKARLKKLLSNSSKNLKEEEIVKMVSEEFREEFEEIREKQKIGFDDIETFVRKRLKQVRTEGR